MGIVIDNMDPPIPDLHTSASQRFPGAPALDHIVNGKGESWLAFRRNLRPRLFVVWRDICICYVMMLLAVVGQGWLQLDSNALLAICSTVAFAVWLGYWLHALSTFGHESAHYNIAGSRRWNDWLAEWFIWPLFAQRVAVFRKLHWQHHMYLGYPNDPERSYHNCLSPWFLTKALTGIYLVQMVVKYTFLRANQSASSRDIHVNTKAFATISLFASSWPIVRSALCHGAIMAGAALLGFGGVTVMWALGAFVFYPFFGTVRQILEHRRADADCNRNFLVETHGAYTRMFGTGWISRFLGAAGFNRHLLHHWDPTVSYTRFDEMEDYFEDTPLASELLGAKTSYLRVFLQIFRSSRRV